MKRTTNRANRRWQQIVRSIPNRAKEEERHQDLMRFHAEVRDEKVWLADRLDEVDALIAALRREVESLQESLDRPRRGDLSHLSPLTNAGKQRVLHKRMLRHSAKLEAVLGEIHRHPVFRDLVSDMGEWEIPEATLPDEEENAYNISRSMMPLLEQTNRLLDGLYRLRRRMSRELLRLARTRQDD